MLPAQREMHTLLETWRRQRALLASTVSTLPSAQKNQYAQVAYLGWHMSIPFTTSLVFPLSFWLCTETCGLSGTAPRMATLVLQGIRLTVEKWPPTGVPKASVVQVVCVRNVLQPGETTARKPWKARSLGVRGLGKVRNNCPACSPPSLHSSPGSSAQIRCAEYESAGGLVGIQIPGLCTGIRI